MRGRQNHSAGRKVTHHELRRPSAMPQQVLDARQNRLAATPRSLGKLDKLQSLALRYATKSPTSPIKRPIFPSKETYLAQKLPCITRERVLLTLLRCSAAISCDASPRVTV
jgi:hypothetical protein